MSKSFYGPFYRFVIKFLQIFNPKYRVKLPENLPDNVVFVSHHQNMFGPFTSILWFPYNLHTWILNVFLDQKRCYEQYVNYTFTKRYKMNIILAKILAFFLSYLMSALLNSGKPIPVYRSSKKVITTLKQSVDYLKKGESVIIFPDVDYSDNSGLIKEMYYGFLSLEKYYYKETNKHLCFVPLYVSKNKRLIIANRLFYFQDNIDFEIERKRVYQEIKDNLIELAKRCGDSE